MPVYDTMTQDEFGYDLKRKLLHTTPEERYQSRKETYYFHELYRDNGEYGCNPTARPEICFPECRFYGATGRFEDDELVAEHKKMVEFYNKHNAIIEIKIQDDNSFVSRKYGSIVCRQGNNQMKIIIIAHNQAQLIKSSIDGSVLGIIADICVHICVLFILVGIRSATCCPTFMRSVR